MCHRKSPNSCKVDNFRQEMSNAVSANAIGSALIWSGSSAIRVGNGPVKCASLSSYNSCAN